MENLFWWILLRIQYICIDGKMWAYVISESSVLDLLSILKTSQNDMNEKINKY